MKEHKALKKREARQATKKSTKAACGCKEKRTKKAETKTLDLNNRKSQQLLKPQIKSDPAEVKLDRIQAVRNDWI